MNALPSWLQELVRGGREAAWPSPYRLFFHPVMRPFLPWINVKPNDVEPYSVNEVTMILTACDTFGRGAYERARARTMVLTRSFWCRSKFLGQSSAPAFPA